jgi:hypothetical protein
LPIVCTDLEQQLLMPRTTSQRGSTLHFVSQNHLEQLRSCVREALAASIFSQGRDQ